MAYGIVEKSGCTVRKGNCQIRLDMFLEPADQRYADRYIEVEPGVWTNTPFHSHFIYLPATFTEQDIKDKIALHLPNFYAAFQDRWDEVQGGMRHGWDTKTRIPPKDYSQSDTPEDYAARVAACQAAVDALGEISDNSSVEGGKIFPATPIDVGPGAINRPSSWASGYTFVDDTNTANNSGWIDTFEVWAATNMGGTYGGVFSGGGTNWDDRDYAILGTVTSGAKRTFTGLSIVVVVGDAAGIYWSSGTIELTTSGGSACYKAGNQFAKGSQSYTGTAYVISIYGTGDTEPPPSPSLGLGCQAAKLIAGKMI